MARMSGFARMITALLCTALLAAGCSRDDGDGDDLGVTSEVASDATTQDIHVFAPQPEGSWPTVVALHGLNGSGQDMAGLANPLTAAGNVVFAPTYRSDLSTSEGLDQASRDIACSYAFARKTAPHYGGDLSQPVTAVGWSLGATFAVLGGLSTATSPATDDPCPGDSTRPDIVVGISGCYYEFQGQHLTWFDDVSGLGNKDADIYLISGDEDTICPAWQSAQLAGVLQDEGFQVTLIELAGADHHDPVFLEERNGQTRVITESEAGDRTVEVLLDAIAANQ